jgi:hypothetical protein
MSSTFPNLSKIPANVSKTIKKRAGNNLDASKLLCWIRVVSAGGVSGEGETSQGGLVLESFQNKKDPENSKQPEKNWSTDNFSTRYGNGSKSGRVGTNFQGDSVYADGNDRAYRPSPIIEGLSIQNGNKGLSRKSTFTIKCFSLGQVEKISGYFLEPGYTVLVEFGWNTALAKSVKEPVLSACNIARNNNYVYTNEKRKKSEGHYDSFLGYITGGGIKSGDGETYLCDVELTTLGEIPTYLQQHKGDNQTGDKKSDSDLKFKPQEIKNEENIGKSLFMQMYNKLPPAKQTSSIMKLKDDTVGDYHGTPWYSAHNFLNMDDEVREKVVEGYTDASVAVKNEDGSEASGKIPEGAPLFSDQSFIRLELAFKILNTCRYKLEADADSKCEFIKKGYSFVIDINSTICRAFPNMFSTDPSILFIPNPESPNFGLVEALTSTELKENFVSMGTNGKLSSATLPTNLADMANFNQDIKTEKQNYAFPAREKLSVDKYFETMKKIDSDVLATDKEAKTWGYLRNLYINFDFFCETISQSNVVTKDIYYELLNGISSAVNSMWYFEIVELPDCLDPAGASRLSVRDFSLCGMVSPGLLKGIDVFESKGKNTPFLSSQLSFDIPAAMKNHVLGKRISENAETIKEGQQPELKSLFAKQEDSVLEILNSLKLTEVDGAESGSVEPAKELTEDEIREKNYEIFIGQAAVYPTLVDREAVKNAKDAWWNKLGAAFTGRENVTINEIAIVGAWKSPSIFTLIQKGHDLTNQGKDVDPILLPINFEFEVHGVSGLRVGDLFKIKDLPEKYTKGIFQIIETAHAIDGNQWKTTVRAQYRNTG